MAKQPSEEQRPPGEDASDADIEIDGEDTPATLTVKGVPRVISLIVLLVVVLLISVLFFRVMASFIVPLFLAAVLAVVFKPLHQWSLRVNEGRPHRSALLTTLIVSLVVIVPTVVLGWRAYVETSRIVRVVLANEPESLAELGDEGLVGPVVVPSESPAVPAEADSRVTASDNTADSATPSDESGWLAGVKSYGRDWVEWYRERIDKNFDPDATLRAVSRYSAQQAVKLGVVGISALVGFVIGMSIMIFALYYFFADGPSIIETVMHLSPLDDEYERELLMQFASVSRAVVVATLLSAVVQGLLAGIGYFFVLDADLPIFLLTVLTMLLAIVPFVGATAVWIPVALWVFFVQNDPWAGVLFAIYGAGIVSTIDNVIKPLVLHGQSNLHPLLALLSILGGIQLLGPVGILVGPMLVAFMQALLGMLKRELDSFRGDTPPLSEDGPAAGAETAPTPSVAG
ncbi:MAG: AI-2E family transporter [Planctomycetota bacterium]